MLEVLNIIIISKQSKIPISFTNMFNVFLYTFYRFEVCFDHSICMHFLVNFTVDKGNKYIFTS